MFRKFKGIFLKDYCGLVSLKNHIITTYEYANNMLAYLKDLDFFTNICGFKKCRLSGLMCISCCVSQNVCNGLNIRINNSWKDIFEFVILIKMKHFYHSFYPPSWWGRVPPSWWGRVKVFPRISCRWGWVWKIRFGFGLVWG